MEVFKLFATMGIKCDEFNKGLNDAKSKGDSFASSFGGALKTIDDTADKIMGGIIKGVTAAGTALVGLGTYASTTAQDMESAYAIIRRGTGEVGETFEGLKESFQTVFSGVPESADEVAAVLANLNTLTGLTGKELEDLTKITLDYARVNGEDAAGSAMTFGRLINALDIPISEATELMDKLTAASQQTGLGVNQLSDYIIAAGPSFEEMGFGVDRSIALFSSFYKSGAEPQELLSSLNILLNKMAKEGLTDAEAAFDDLLNSIKDAPDILSATTIASEMFGGRVGAKVADDIRAGRFEIDEFVDALQNVSGTVAQTAEDTMTFSDKLAIMKNQAALAIEPLGSAVIDIFSEGLNVAGGYLGELTAAFKSAEDPMSGFAAMIASLGDILADVVMRITEALPQFVQMGVDLISALAQGLTENSEAILQGAMTAFTTLIDGIQELLPQLVPLAVDILMTLADGFVQYKEFIYTTGVEILTQLILGIVEQLPDLIDTAQSAIMNIANTLMENLPIILQAGIDILDALIRGIADMLPELVPIAVTIIVDLVETLLNNLGSILDAGFKLLEGLTDGLLQALPILISKLPDIIIAILDFFINAIPALIEAGATLLSAIVADLPTIINAIVEALPKIIDAILSAIIEYLPMLTDAGIKLFTALVGAINEIITIIVSVLPGLMSSIISALMDNLPAIIEAGITLFVSLISALPEIIQGIVSAIPILINGIIQNIIENLPAIIEVGIMLFSALVSNLPVIISAIVSVIPAIVDGIKDAFIEFLEVFANIGGLLMDGLKSGLLGKAAEIVDSVRDLGGKIVGGLKGVLGIQSPSRVFEGVGTQLMAGLNKGVIEGHNAVMGNIKKVGENISNAMKAVFGVKSPSTVFAGIGRNLGEGLIVGVEGMEKQVEDAVEDSFGDLGEEIDVTADINAKINKRGGIDEEGMRDARVRDEDMQDSWLDRIAKFLGNESADEAEYDRAAMEAELFAMKAEMEAELAAAKADMEAALKQRLEDSKDEIKSEADKKAVEAEIMAMKADMTAELTAMKADMEAELAEAKARMEAALTDTPVTDSALAKDADAKARLDTAQDTVNQDARYDKDEKVSRLEEIRARLAKDKQAEEPISDITRVSEAALIEQDKMFAERVNLYADAVELNGGAEPEKSIPQTITNFFEIHVAKLDSAADIDSLIREIGRKNEERQRGGGLVYA